MHISHKKSPPLEKKQRLSRSILWKLQRDYYGSQGIEAWRTDNLPHLITCNPFLADAYARVVFGYLRDCCRAGRECENPPPTPLDPGKPIYVVELGSGHGRFSYLFLKKFFDAHRSSVLAHVPVKYVMTDFAQRNVDFWRSHLYLQPFVESGLLDFALFDIETDNELKLIESGEVLSAETIRNPVVIIANYIFDSIPQDAFFVEKGQLYESLVTVSPLRETAQLNAQEILSRIELTYDQNPVHGQYYEDAEWDSILTDYGQRLAGTAFLFPTAALRCVRNFHEFSGGRMLLLSADKGYNRDEALQDGLGFPGIAMHTSFSMMVDYQIIGEYFLRRGGQIHHPAHRHSSIGISAFTLGNPPGGHIETRQAYQAAIETFGPDDLFLIKEKIEEGSDRFTMEQIIAFLRLTAWDFRSFFRCIASIKDRLPESSDVQKRELYSALTQVWNAYFPIGEDHDLAFQIGTLLVEMEYYSEALEFLEQSVSMYGPEPGTAYNMAVCYFSLRQNPKAIACIDQALEMDPAFDEARSLRIRLESWNQR